ncbi:hypothetical protein Pcinc_003596 [Petrolisthes cinctipes]|uniref:Uncharacterized protein n=1 Tax=Petrolisthes cinctipes TaxID=88211 RepID=A0AAE1GH50_PETCI|nr:hypothetical protein Pcinc_003596 [Petrolisthes cinctipes]
MTTCGVSPKAVLGKSEYCLMVQHLWKVHQQEYERYYAQPHSHPLYHQEWITFISTRSRSVVELGGDPKDYDFYLEWKGVWMSRLQELEVEEWKIKKQDSLKASFIHAKSHNRSEHKHKHHPNVLGDDSPTRSTKSGSRSRSPSISPTQSTESGSRSRSPSTRLRSRSPSTRHRSRSPSTKFRSRSRYERLRSRSPCTKLRSRIPSTRFRSRNPSTKFRPRSPSTRLRSRIPSTRFRSRIPSTRFRSRSPSTRFRLRIPSTRLRSRSPSTRLRSRSPSKRFRSRSPSTSLRSWSLDVRLGSSSPSTRSRSRSPSKRLRSRSPSKRLRSRSPSTRSRSRSPYKRLRSRSPSTSLRSRSPSKRLRSRSPSKRLRSRSSSTRLRSRSPYERLGSRSSYTSLRSPSPSKRFRSRSPSTSLGSLSPSTSLKSESPFTRLRSYVKLRSQCGLGSRSPFVRLRSISPYSRLRSHHHNQLSDSTAHHDNQLSDSKTPHHNQLSDSTAHHHNQLSDSKTHHDNQLSDSKTPHHNQLSDSTAHHHNQLSDSTAHQDKHDEKLPSSLEEKPIEPVKDLSKIKSKKSESKKKHKKSSKKKKKKKKISHEADEEHKKKKEKKVSHEADKKDKNMKDKQHNSDKTLKEKKDGKDKKTKEKKHNSDKTLRKMKEKKVSHEADGKDKKTKEKEHDSDKTQKKGDDDGDELKKAMQKLVNDKVVNNSEAHVSVPDNDTNINSNPKSQCSVPINNEDKSVVPSETITKKDDNTESSKVLKMNIEKCTDKNKNTDIQDSVHKNMLLLKQYKETVMDKKMKKKEEELKNERKSCKKTTTSTTTKDEGIAELKRSLVTENISSPENSNDFLEKCLNEGKKYTLKSEIASTKHYEKIRSWERNSHDPREKTKRREYNESKRNFYVRRDSYELKGKTKRIECADLKRSSEKINLDKRSDCDELKRSSDNRSLYKRRFNEKRNSIEIKRSLDKRSNSDKLKRRLSQYSIHPEENNIFDFSHKHRDDDGISNNVKERRTQRKEEYSSCWRKDVKSRNETFPCGSKEHHKKKKNNVMTNYKDVIDVCSESLDSEDTMSPSRFSQFGKDAMSSTHNSTSGKNRGNIKSQLKSSSEIYVSSESCASSIFDEAKITPKNIKGSLRKCFDLSDIENTSTSSILTWIESPVHKCDKNNIACSESYDDICYDSDEKEEDLSIIKELQEAGEDILILSDNDDERSSRMGDSNASHMNMNVELNLNKGGSSSIEVESGNVDRKSTQKIVPLFSDVNNSGDDSLSSADSDLCEVYEEIGRFFKSSESNNDVRTSASFTSHTDTSNDTNTDIEMNINWSDTDTSIEMNVDWSDNINNIIDVSNVQILNTLHLLNASGEVLGNMTQEVSCLYNTARELNTQELYFGSRQQAVLTGPSTSVSRDEENPAPWSIVMDAIAELRGEMVKLKEQTRRKGKGKIGRVRAAAPAELKPVARNSEVVCMAISDSDGSFFGFRSDASAEDMEDGEIHDASLPGSVLLQSGPTDDVS